MPQVVLPLFSFDQFANADRVAAVGVGVALVDETADEPRAGDLVPHGPAATDRLADALCALLEQRKYSDRAGELTPEINSLPDVDACSTATS